MQAVILAAGKSTRTYPLTLTKPKPLLKVANKTILEHNLDNLKNIVEEIILIVGYKKDMIKKKFGDKYKNIKIYYVEQKEQLGTGHAALLAEPYIKDRFILMAGDDIYHKEDVRNCLKHQYAILTAKDKNPSNASELRLRTRSQLTNFGVIVEKNGILVDFVEKPKKFISNLINTSLYCLDKNIFQYLKKIKKSKRDEYELPDAIKMLSKREKIHCIKAKQWLPIGYPWDLLKADGVLRWNKNLIGENSKITGKVINSSIGGNCTINGVVKNSIVMDNTIIDHGSIVKDSVIGENVYFQGKTNGAIIADNVKAENAIINAGCKIWPNKTISNKTIKEDMA